MEVTANLIGKILFDLVEEAQNEYEALDIYSSKLHKNILMKERANIDYKDDLELYIFLQAYRSKIADKIYKQELKGWTWKH